MKNECKSLEAKISIIPGGLTKILQQLDVGVNRSLKVNSIVNGKNGGCKAYTHSLTVEECAEHPTWKLCNGSKQHGKLLVNQLSETTESCNIDKDKNDNDNSVLNENIWNLFLSNTDDSKFEGFN